MERSNANCEDAELEIVRESIVIWRRDGFAGMEGAHDKEISGRFERQFGKKKKKYCGCFLIKMQNKCLF